MFNKYNELWGWAEFFRLDRLSPLFGKLRFARQHVVLLAANLDMYRKSPRLILTYIKKCRMLKLDVNQAIPERSCDG